MKKLLTLLITLGICSAQAATRMQPSADEESAGRTMRGYSKQVAGMAREGAEYVDARMVTFRRKADEVVDALGAAKDEAQVISGELKATGERVRATADEIRHYTHKGLDSVDRMRQTIAKYADPFKFDTVDYGIMAGAGVALSSALASQAYREYRALRHKYPNISKSEMLTKLIRGAYRRAIRAVGGKEGAVIQVLEIAGVLGMLALTGRYVYKNRDAMAQKAKNYWHGAEDHRNQEDPNSYAIGSDDELPDDFNPHDDNIQDLT